MDAPKGRYRIEERERRLVTIDTLTGEEVGMSGTRAAHLAVDAVEIELETNAPSVIVQPEISVPIATQSDSQTWRTPQSERPIADKAAREHVSEWAGLMPGASAQGSGYILKTSRFYDHLGPRVVMLDAEGAKTLGSLMLLVLVGAIFTVLIVVIIAGENFWIALLAIGFVLLRGLKPVAQIAMKRILAEASIVE
ncbi:MAG: hypothetical protein WBO17_06815 [Sphingorhabdus sp.]